MNCFFKKNISTIFSIMLLVNTPNLTAQVSPAAIKNYLESKTITISDIAYPNETKAFYIANKFSAVWLITPLNSNITTLVNWCQQAADNGLNAADYQPILFGLFRSSKLLLNTQQDSVTAEIKFTDAAIHFFHDALMGHHPVPFDYDGLKYIPACYDIPALINNYMSNNRFSSLLKEVESRDAAYNNIKNKIITLRKMIYSIGFKDEIVLPQKKVNNLNRLLITRLYQLGFISDTLNLSDEALVTKVKSAQQSFNLMADGVLRTTATEAFNIPLSQRVMELSDALNTLRWIYCLQQAGKVVVVNIPSANLLLYDKGKIIFESRIIVGKKATPTPTLSSRITDVIAYPYWVVPYKIATKEMLPVIKKSIAYFDSNNLQVINKNGKVLDPYSINWHSLSSSYFPYTLRQSTGCDNSLGIFKLNFENPFSVYLHDTPWKSLFGFNNRYFSHGCMRLEKAMELAHIVLKGNTVAVDTLEEKGCLFNQPPVNITASEIIPVIVLYNTVWIDAIGTVCFYEDPYHKFLPK